MCRENVTDLESFKSDGLNIYMTGKELSRSREDKAGIRAPTGDELGYGCIASPLPN